MDAASTGEELGAEVEGVRNRLSFLQHNPTPGYVALDQEKAGDGVTSLQDPDNAASTPFDALFLTLYFVQIYVLQLILTLVIVIWTFLDADDLEHDVLLSLDCYDPMLSLACRCVTHPESESVRHHACKTLRALATALYDARPAL